MHYPVELKAYPMISKLVYTSKLMLLWPFLLPPLGISAISPTNPYSLQLHLLLTPSRKLLLNQISFMILIQLIGFGRLRVKEIVLRFHQTEKLRNRHKPATALVS